MNKPWQYWKRYREMERLAEEVLEKDKIEQDARLKQHWKVEEERKKNTAKERADRARAAREAKIMFAKKKKPEGVMRRRSRKFEELRHGSEELQMGTNPLKHSLNLLPT
jgi:hypothetical protein